MKTNQQTEIVIFKKQGSEMLFLILKRNPQKGGFWQPITGGVEQGETFEQTAVREVYEEIGIAEAKLLDIDFSFEFFDHGENHLEKCFAVEVSPDAEIILSDEHTEFKWVDIETAINQFLKYPNNKKAFQKTMDFIKTYERNNKLHYGK